MEKCSSKKTISPAIQDYLKTIYKLQENGAVATTDIAKELNVSSASVTGMLKRLETMSLESIISETISLETLSSELSNMSNVSLVDYNSYKGVKLTEVGEKIALEILRRHRLLELYLKEVMGFSLDKVHEEACRLEHHISKEFADKLCDLLGDPKFDPHGHPIPTKEGKIPTISESQLSDVDAEKKVKILRLADKDDKLLGYLEELGILPGVQIRVIEKAPFNGPVTIELAGERKIIGDEVARSIFVVVE